MRQTLLGLLVLHCAISYADDGGTATTSDRPGGPIGARVQRLVDEAVAAESARAGGVAPVWRDLERELERQFQPTPADVTTQSAGQLLLAQYRAGLGRDPGVTARSGKSAYDQPASWRRTEVEVVVDSAGQLVDAHVVVPSGMKRLDATALAAARAAVAARPPQTVPASGRRRVRFAVESGIAVTPIEAAPLALPGTTSPNGAVVKLSQLQFDETRRATPRLEHPLMKTVYTRVSLVFVRGD